MRSNLTYRNPSPRTLRSSSSPPPKTGAPRFYRTSPCPSSIAFGLYSFLFSRFSGDTLHSVSAFRLFSGSREREREREKHRGSVSQSRVVGVSFERKRAKHQEKFNHFVRSLPLLEPRTTRPKREHARKKRRLSHLPSYRCI